VSTNENRKIFRDLRKPHSFTIEIRFSIGQTGRQDHPGSNQRDIDLLDLLDLQLLL
jgi:hypothetical protein